MKNTPGRIRLRFAPGVLLFAAALLFPIHSIEKAKLELQGWGGVNLATKSTFAKEYTDATFIQPKAGITAWASQPFLLPEVLDIGLSLGWQPIMTYTSGTGSATSVVAYPVTIEARYRFPHGIFATLGAGYAYTRLKVNNESTGTNAMVINAKGGYQYEFMPNLSAVGTLELMYLLQTLTFAGAGDKANSQLNIGVTVGVAYKL